ncbi:MAG: BMC domain-containing protein [Eubacteriales bacterium]
MSIGIIEIQNYANALLVSDLVSKNGNINLIYNKNNIGGRLVTLVFEGSVSDLRTAFDSAKTYFQKTKYLKVSEVVPNPTKEVMHYLEKGDFDYGGK